MISARLEGHLGEEGLLVRADLVERKHAEGEEADERVEERHAHPHVPETLLVHAGGLLLQGSP